MDKKSLQKRKSASTCDMSIINFERSSFAFAIGQMAIAQLPRDAETLPVVKIPKEALFELGYTPEQLTSNDEKIIEDLVEDLLNYRIISSQLDSDNTQIDVTGEPLFIYVNCDKNADLNLILNPNLAPLFDILEEKEPYPTPKNLKS